MTTLKTSQRYPLPDPLEAGLAELKAYWDGIQRGFRIMPYWDDVDMTRLGALRRQVVLLDAPQAPDRFRFNLVGEAVAEAYGQELEDRFVDEIAPAAPLHELTEQCQATAAESAPTYFRHREAGYARLLLPLWGNGRVEMLIGCISETG